MGKNKHGKRKQCLTNVEIPLSKTNANVLRTSNEQNDETVAPKSILKRPIATTTTYQTGAPPASSTSTATGTKYNQPELHTTLGISKQIEALRNQKPPSITKVGQLTPSSKKRFNTEITKQLNHNIEQVLFKRLAPVNVNDTVLLPAPGSMPPANPKSKYLFKGKKDPEPTLSDYMHPIRRYTFNVNVPQEPIITSGALIAGNSWNNCDNIDYVLRIMDE